MYRGRGIKRSSVNYMASDVAFKLNLQGLNELMKSAEMQAVLDEAGRAVANVAGDGYTTTGRTGQYIGFSNVYPEDKQAAKDNYENNTLLKALGSVGLRQTK